MLYASLGETMKRLKKSAIVIIVLFSLSLSGLYSPSETIETKAASSKMPKSLYKKLKGKWYTQASSAGWDIKFTKTKVNYYDRSTSKVAYSYKIKKVVKIKSGDYKGGYRIVFKIKKNLCSFIGKPFEGFNFYEGASGYEGYSGSSSIAPGRWSD